MSGKRNNLQGQVVALETEKLHLENELKEKDKEIENLKQEIERLKEDFEKEKYLVDKYTRQLTDEYKNTEYQCKEKERLNNIINKGIEAINVYQNEKTLSVGYQDLKRIRGILQGNEFDLQMFEEYLQELKGRK